MFILLEYSSIFTGLIKQRMESDVQANLYNGNGIQGSCSVRMVPFFFEKRYPIFANAN